MIQDPAQESTHRAVEFQPGKEGQQVEREEDVTVPKYQLHLEMCKSLKTLKVTLGPSGTACNLGIQCSETK